VKFPFLRSYLTIAGTQWRAVHTLKRAFRLFSLVLWILASHTPCHCSTTLQGQNMNRKNPRKRMVTTLAGFLSVWALQSHATDLTVHLHGLQTSDGNVMVALYNSEASFMKEATQSSMVSANTSDQSSSVTLVFKNLAKGQYALTAFHDVNANGKLDSNAFRIPTEPVGFSNGATPRFGPPKFTEASFEFDGQAAAINIDLK